MKYFHICLSGNDEIMFRTDEDYCRAINCLALAAYKTDSKILAYAFMSTHVHLCIRTDHPYKVITTYRYAYTRYFNAKYKRHGKLGERHPFVIELEGLYHTLTAICYILRNPLHHGVSETAFGYPYTSIHAYFRKAMGKTPIPEDMLLATKLHYRHLPYMAPRPNGYNMNRHGAFTAESFISTTEVEHMFVTGRSFCFYMNRISSEEWIREQEKDNNNAPIITLKKIESGIRYNSLEEMLNNEHGRADYNKISDITLCRLIDESTPDGETVYTLNDKEKKGIFLRLCKNRKTDARQLRRCLSLNVRDIDGWFDSSMSRTGNAKNVQNK